MIVTEKIKPNKIFKIMKNEIYTLLKNEKMKNKAELIDFSKNSISYSQLPTDPNGLYSRIEISLSKNNRFVKKTQDYIDNPAQNIIAARPFGFETQEVYEPNELTLEHLGNLYK